MQAFPVFAKSTFWIISKYGNTRDLNCIECTANQQIVQKTTTVTWGNLLSLFRKVGSNKQAKQKKTPGKRLWSVSDKKAFVIQFWWGSNPTTHTTHRQSSHILSSKLLPF